VSVGRIRGDVTKMTLDHGSGNEKTELDVALSADGGRAATSFVSGWEIPAPTYKVPALVRAPERQVELGGLERLTPSIAMAAPRY
jgi:hypothetical protein